MFIPLRLRVLGLLLGAAVACNASVITPVSVTANTNWGPRVPGFTIDGSGLDVNDITGLHGTDPDTSMWLAGCGGCTGGTIAWIEWDLGQVYNLADIALWNYNEAATLNLRGVSTADVQISLNDILFSDLGSQSFLQAPGAPGYAADIYSFPVTARYVKFNITSPFDTGAGFVGLSEIRFIQAAPEPASAGLFLLGGAVLLGLRRFRRA